MRVKVRTVILVSAVALIVALGSRLAFGQAVINGARTQPEISSGSISNPPANSLTTFVCDDGGTTKLCSKDSAGTVAMGLGGGSGGGTLELMTYTNAVAETCDGGAEGTIILLTGSVYEFVRCESSAWVPYRNGLPCVEPVFNAAGSIGGWARINAGSETTDSTNGGVLIDFPATSTTFSPKGWVKSEISTPYTITACMVINTITFDGNIPFLMGWMDGNTTSDDLLTYDFAYEVAAVAGWNHDILFSSPYLTPVSHPQANRIQAQGTTTPDDLCMQIAVDSAGTPNRYARFSVSGLPGTFVQIYTATHTTTITPTHLMFGGQSRTTLVNTPVWVYHWEETSP